jgi:hypothetical protein
MANTNILIKRSSSTRQPSSLAAGELAYSYQSNTLFLGNAAGNGVINVGGVYYTQSIDNATSAATPGTIVRRDASGNATFQNITVNGFISGTIDGVANAAVYLRDSQNFSVSGGDISATAVSFNGTGPVTLNASLNSIAGLSAGTYGSSTAIPVLNIAANGRITGVSTQSISTQFTLTGDTGNTTISGGDTLAVVGGAGITSVVSGDQVTLDVDNTVVRSNTAITSQTIDGSLTIAGNLTVQGTQTTVNTYTLNVADPLIILAANNASDAIDIGFAGHYNDGATDRHTGFFRDAGTKEYYVFDGYTPELYSNNSIDVAAASFHKANLNAGYAKVDGIFSNGINLDTRIQNIYNSANTNASDITIIQGVNTTQNTRITAVDSFAQGAYNKANNSVQASSNLTFGQLVVADGNTSLKSLANSSYTLTGTLGASKTITSFTVDAYGRVTAATAGNIAISSSAVSGLAAVATSGNYSDLSGAPSLASIATSGSGSDITTGTVAVSYGGTGRNTFTTNGLVFGNSTDGLLVTASAGTSDQTFSNQILTVTNAGVPVWSSALDGGTF